MATATRNGHKPTAAAAWKGAPASVALPSGNKAVLRDVLSVYEVIRTGKADDEILEAFDMAQAGKLEDNVLGVRLQDVIVEAMFVDPRIGDGEGELPLAFLTDADVDFVVSRAFGGAPDPSFRDDADGAGAGGDGKDVRDDTERDAGDSAGKPRGAGDGPKAGGKAPVKRQRPARGAARKKS